MRHPRSPRIVWLLLIAAALVRVGLLAGMPDALTADPDEYRRLAENVLEHGVFGSGRVPTAYRPPAYPLLLVPCVALGPAARVAIGALHVALGIATVGLTLVLARRAGMSDVPATLAAALVALDPILLAQSAQVMSETPAALLAVLAVVLLDRCSRQPSVKNAFPAGVALGALVLCRPALLAFPLLAVLLLPWFASPAGERGRTKLRGRSLRALAGVVAGLALVVGPWVVRNHAVVGRPTAATTHGGYTLLLSNNAYFYDHLARGSWFRAWEAAPFHAWWRRELAAAELLLPPTELPGRSAANNSAVPPLRFRSPEAELQADALAYRHAFAAMRARPGMFAWSCAVRAGHFWSPLPFQVSPDESPPRRAARLGVAAWYAPQFVLAAVGLACVLWRAPARRPVFLWGLLLALTLTAVHTFFWSNLRMRAPLMPLVAIAAAEGAVRVWHRLKKPGRRFRRQVESCLTLG